jgi:hypothetical protein
MQPRGDAAHAVAALAAARSVGIEDVVGERACRISRGFDRQQLVETDAGVTIAESGECRCVERERTRAAIDDDKIVADSMHLAEVQAHRARCAVLVPGGVRR